MDTKLLDKVEGVGSSNQKKILLSGLKEDTLRFLRLALDPGVTFGVTVDGEQQVGRSMLSSVTSDPQKWWNEFYVLCNKLRTRSLTGNAAAKAIEDLMWSSCHTSREDDVKWACRILNKDLRCGFSYSTLNKVFPQSIDKFQVALAEPFDPDKHEIYPNSIIDRKLDGLRMVVLDGQAYTRNGKIISTVGHILQVLEQVDPNNEFVFDGEIMGSEDFDTNSGAVRRSSGGTNTSLVYNIFDCVRREEWRSKKTRPLSERKEDLEFLLRDGPEEGKPWPFIQAVPYEWLPKKPSAEQLFEMRDKLIKQGFEGAMVKNADAPYVFKRSDNILKIKEFKDIDCRIVEFLEGEGRLKGTLGAIRVEHDSPKGVVRTKVGSGFDDETRTLIWKNRKSWLNGVAEIQYQNFTEDGTMRFPIFIKRRPDKE